MAKTKVNEVTKENENQTVKPITIRSKSDPNEVYILEFSRFTVKEAERNGFNIDSVIGSAEGTEADATLKVSMTAMEKLFYYSFLMHQPGMKPVQANRILYDEIHGLTPAMITRLIELYMITFNTLVQDEENLKNSTMTIEL